MDRFTVRRQQWPRWIQHFLPTAEPLFFTEGEIAAALSAAGELIYTRAELTESFPSFALDHGNAYNLWCFDRSSLVWFADRNARGRIDLSLWAKIRDEQGKNSRGQVFDDSWPLRVDVPKADRLSDGRWLLAPDTWRAQDVKVQQQWLREWMARRLVEDELNPVDAEVAPRYRELVNQYAYTFADSSGPNCFAAALGAALGRPQDVFPLWLHQEPFLRALRGNGFHAADDREPKEGDVVVWADTAGTPVHAAFCVDDGLLFNKNGQSWEQPYAVVALSDVRDFNGVLTAGGTITAYRRQNHESSDDQRSARSSKTETAIW